MDLNLPIMLSTEKITLNICVHRQPSSLSVTLISSSRCSVLLPTDDSLQARSRDDFVDIGRYYFPQHFPDKLL